MLMLISKNAFIFYTILSTWLLVKCEPSGPFGSYLLASGASSIGLIIHSGKSNDTKTNANN